MNRPGVSGDCLKGLSIRALARKHKVHRRDVRQSLASAVPPPRKTPDRAPPVLGPHEATIRRWLTDDLEAPKKQRHTARRIWQRLRTPTAATPGHRTHTDRRRPRPRLGP